MTVRIELTAHLYVYEIMRKNLTTTSQQQMRKYLTTTSQ